MKVIKQETKERFKLPGRRVTSFKRNVPLSQCEPSLQSIMTKPKLDRNNKAKIGQTVSKQFDVVKVRGDSAYFKEINQRFQALFLFYIDGASFIDQDPNWHYFVCYLDHKVVGFTSVLEDKKSKGANVLLS